MRLESRHSSELGQTGGLLGCAVALLLVVVTGGAAFIPALLLLALGGYAAGRTQVRAVALSAHFRTLTVDSTRFFTSATQTFPVSEITTRYVAQGGLRSAKYYTLDIWYQHRKVASLDPKAGFNRVEMERFHAALLASQTESAGGAGN